MIANISTGSAVAGSVEFRYLLYLYFLSSVATQDGQLISAYRVRDARDAFESFGVDAVPEAVLELTREKLILPTPDGVIVGKVVARKKVLFSVKDDSVNLYKQRLLDKLTEYADTAVRKARARRALVDAEMLWEKPIAEWLITDFCKLYELAYEAVYEEPLRDLTHKERGQIKYLLNNYERSTLQKMVVHFVLNADTYARKTAPTIGLLVYHKDTLKLAVEEKSKASTTRSKMRESSTKTEDF